MALTGKIIAITPSADGSGIGVNWLTTVDFADSATGFTSTKIYSFPMTTTQASGVATITADMNNLKSALASASTLAGKIGSVITV